MLFDTEWLFDVPGTLYIAYCRLHHQLIYSVSVELFVSMSKRFLISRYEHFGNDLATSVTWQSRNNRIVFTGYRVDWKIPNGLFYLGQIKVWKLLSLCLNCVKGWSLGSEAITRFARDFVAITTAAQPKRRKVQTRPGGKTISLEICQRVPLNLHQLLMIFFILDDW